MNLQDYFTILAPDDICISGTRIGIENILYEYIYRGKTPAEIAQPFHTVKATESASPSCMSIQYLLDEHIARLYRAQLVRREPELVVRIIGDPDAPPKAPLTQKF